MEIIGNIKGSLRCEDLECGEVFTFLDNNKICMLCPDSYDTYIVNLATGDIEGTMEDFSKYSNTILNQCANLLNLYLYSFSF